MSAVRAEIARLGQLLASKLELAEQRRRDEIMRLQEALYIADALGIESGSVTPVASGQQSPGSIVSVNTVDEPLYFRGSKALKLEISVLEARKLNEPFVGGVRDLQERLRFLEGVQITKDDITAVRVDADARTPYRAEKPRKALILGLAIVLGLVAGLSAVFVREARSKMRADSEQGIR